MDHESWAPIEGYPNYQVSDQGRILNVELDQLMRISYNQYGGSKVSLRNRYGRQTLSVALCVARAFVPVPDPTCVSVIVLDGNTGRLSADNLEWRTPSFAWKYTQQLKKVPPAFFDNLPVRDITTGQEYGSVVIAGMTHGLLFIDIWRSTYQGVTVPPTKSRFEVIHE